MIMIIIINWKYQTDIQVSLVKQFLKITKNGISNGVVFLGGIRHQTATLGKLFWTACGVISRTEFLNKW